MAKLGEVCTIVSGSTPKTSVTSYWDGNIKWITPAELNEDTFYIMDSVRHITEEGKEKTGLSYLPTGTVILSSRAPIGKTAIAGCEMCCNQGFKNLICSDAIYNEYLYFFLKSKTDYLNSLGRGATFKEISKSIVESIEIPLPEVNQQKGIAEKFKKLEQLISLRKQQLTKLDELVKARFVEMFGSYPENENAYPVVNVSDIADAGVGVVIKPAQYYVTEERGIKAFRSLNIGEMYIKDSDWVYFSTEGNESNKKSQLHENDLLIVRSGAPGTSCVVTKEFEGCNAVDVIIAHPNLSKVNPWYLCAYINYPHGKKQIEEGTGGAAQQHFNVGKCNNLKVLLPPLEPQNQFAAFVERVNQQKQVAQQSLEKLELMKKALMQEYFG
ncbi:MAG: restriction endonuclease subunit S [Faecalibacterium prausnitzii]|nr:restriction endonuclease subunit S [Faecalibacterium prausnitzii]